MKEFKGVDAAFNLFMSKFGDTELWLQCDKCGEKIREDIGAHKCKEKQPIEGELVDLIELYCKDKPKKG
jgi:hypothetical protein